MTPEEINEAVARKLGWTSVGKPCCEEDANSYGLPPGVKGDAEADGEIVPDYCHSTAVAWEVADLLGSEIAIWRIGKKWIISLLDSQGLAETVAEADTAPMAICLAFLKLP